MPKSAVSLSQLPRPKPKPPPHVHLGHHHQGFDRGCAVMFLGIAACC
jgi:hypothetical protein